MIEKAVIEGPPGAGKSTLLYGNRNEHGDQPPHELFVNEGISIVPETFNVVWDQMVAEGRFGDDDAVDEIPQEARNELIRRIVELQSMEFTQAEGRTLFDRGMHDMGRIAEVYKAEVPKNYTELCGQTRYGCVFVLDPISRFDLASGAAATRTFTLEQREQKRDQAREIYQQAGFRVIDVPEYAGDDIDESCRKRRELILDALNS